MASVYLAFRAEMFKFNLLWLHSRLVVQQPSASSLHSHARSLRLQRGSAQMEIHTKFLCLVCLQVNFRWVNFRPVNSYMIKVYLKADFKNNPKKWTKISHRVDRIVHTEGSMLLQQEMGTSGVFPKHPGFLCSPWGQWLLNQWSKSPCAMPCCVWRSGDIFQQPFNLLSYEA